MPRFTAITWLPSSRIKTFLPRLPMASDRAHEVPLGLSENVIVHDFYPADALSEHRRA